MLLLNSWKTSVNEHGYYRTILCRHQCQASGWIKWILSCKIQNILTAIQPCLCIQSAWARDMLLHVDLYRELKWVIRKGQSCSIRFVCLGKALMVVCPKNNFGSHHGIGFRHGPTNPRKKISLGVTVLELCTITTAEVQRMCSWKLCRRFWSPMQIRNCWSWMGKSSIWALSVDWNSSRM